MAYGPSIITTMDEYFPAFITGIFGSDDRWQPVQDWMVNNSHQTYSIIPHNYQLIQFSFDYIKPRACMLKRKFTIMVTFYVRKYGDFCCMLFSTDTVDKAYEMLKETHRNFTGGDIDTSVLCRFLMGKVVRVKRAYPRSMTARRRDIDELPDSHSFVMNVRLFSPGHSATCNRYLQGIRFDSNDRNMFDRCAGSIVNHYEFIRNNNGNIPEQQLNAMIEIVRRTAITDMYCRMFQTVDTNQISKMFPFCSKPDPDISFNGKINYADNERFLIRLIEEIGLPTGKQRAFIYKINFCNHYETSETLTLVTKPSMTNPVMIKLYRNEHVDHYTVTAIIYRVTVTITILAIDNIRPIIAEICGNNISFDIPNELSGNRTSAVSFDGPERIVSIDRKLYFIDKLQLVGYVPETGKPNTVKIRMCGKNVPITKHRSDKRLHPFYCSKPFQTSCLKRPKTYCRLSVCRYEFYQQCLDNSLTPPTLRILAAINFRYPHLFVDTNFIMCSKMTDLLTFASIVKIAPCYRKICIIMKAIDNELISWIPPELWLYILSYC
jgi:hypothetical protein